MIGGKSEAESKAKASEILSMLGLGADVSLIASGKMRMKIFFQCFAIGVVLVSIIFFIRPLGYIGASYTICILWGTLLLLYFSYASYKKLISPVGMLRFFIPSVLTIMNALFFKHYLSSQSVRVFLFFTVSSFIWIVTLTFFYRNHLSILK